MTESKSITYHCPDDGGEMDVLYRRGEFDTPRVTCWCPICKDWKVVETDENWVPLSTDSTGQEDE